MEQTKVKSSTERRYDKSPHHQNNPINQKNVDIQADQVEIIMLTSYPPRECGIATYSSDLVGALQGKFVGSFKLSICPVETGPVHHAYPDDILRPLGTDGELDYLRLAMEINDNADCGMVLVQHEFGLFANNEKLFYEFLESLNKPVAITFHTVLPAPDSILRDKVKRMASSAAAIIVMTRNSAEILHRDYGIELASVSVIPHGTHLVRYESRDSLKFKYGLCERNVLSTFGLLGPGKNIETTLEALPTIIKHYPDTVFLIIGKTHPNLKMTKGEDYRAFLEYKIEKLGLQDHVRFINKFVPLRELLELLQLSDIYLFTSKDVNQAVSGTFSYALSCGCPIISTPIPHAREVLRNGAGTLFGFENPEELSGAVIELMRDGGTRERMSLNGLQTTAESAWENAAIAHAKLFEGLSTKKFGLVFKKPAIDLDHLKKMTTKTGIIQFSKINQPDIDSGYTLDDNARALIVACRHYLLTGDRSDIGYIVKYFNFVKNCFRPGGTFLNYVDVNNAFTAQNDEVNLQDANGRAMWGLGNLISIAPRLGSSCEILIQNAECIFQEGLVAMSSYRSPRAIAFILKGIYYFTLNRTSLTLIETARKFADQLMEHLGKCGSREWSWFEPYLTYGNAVLPQSLLMAYELTGVSDYKSAAKETFDFLLSKIFLGRSIRVVSNIEWLSMEKPLSAEFEGGEQPIDVAYTIMALKNFHAVFPDEGYGIKMEAAFEWFMGDNSLSQIIYNPCTGGCYDGLEKNNVNLNQGAESVVSYLLARMAFEIAPEV